MISVLAFLGAFAVILVLAGIFGLCCAAAEADEAREKWMRSLDLWGKR